MTGLGKTTVGRMSYVSLCDGAYRDIPAKNDTGAYTSSIWASDIQMADDGTLSFRLFAEGSDYYTGEQINTHKYEVRIVRSSNGEEQARYLVQLPIEMEGQTFVADFTLSSRDRNRFPILIGARLLSQHFVVDVDHNIDEYRRYSSEADDDLADRQAEAQEIVSLNPQLFHQEHHNGEKS